MELKRIEMIGFKSFPEKITVNFDKGITAIIGPNGSGKSNISDAIRWVLGEQSAKSLRGSKMEDVIFAGTERRKPIGYAMVTLVLDNSDHKITLPYDEIAICRKVYRSGESEYLVNNTHYRLKDIHEMLMDTGIGKDGYSVIGQGRIDQLLSTKPQERRLIFEEAAGIVKYKTRKEEAAKQLAEEAISLSRVEDRLRDMEDRLGPMEKQAETARKYRELEGELKVYEISSFLDQYKQYSEAYQKNKGLLDALEVQLQEAEAKQQEAEARAASYAAEADAAGRRVTDLTKNIGDLRLQKETAEGERKVNLMEQEHLRQEMAGGTTRLKTVKSRLAELSHTVKGEEKRSEQLKQERTTAEASQQEANQQDRIFSQEILELDQKTLQEEKTLTQMEQERAELTGQLERERAQAEHGENAGEETKNRQEELLSSHEELTEQLETLQAQIRLAQESQEGLHQQAAAEADQVRKLEEQIGLLREKQTQALQDLRTKQERINWLAELEKSHEGFSGSVKTVMQLKNQEPGRWNGIHGTVADVLSVPTNLAAAVDVALGAAVQNIIVDTQQVAQRLIEILRSKHAGRATFQPLNVVTGRDHGRDESAIRGIPGVIGFADDLVHYDPKYQGIISRLLGNCVITEDFETGAAFAKRYNKYYRAVTLKGDIFNIGGSITGGSLQERNGGSIISRRGEQEELRKQQHEIREQSGRLQQQISELSREKDLHQRSLDEADRQYETASRSLQELIRQESQQNFILEQLSGQVSDVEKEHQAALEEAKNRRSRVEALEGQAREQEDLIAAQTLKVQALKADQSEKRTAKDKIREQLMLIQIQISGIGSQLSSFEHALQWEYEEMEKLSQEADTILDSQESGRERLQELEAQDEQLVKAQETRTEEIETLTSRMASVEEDRTEAEKLREQGVREAQETIRIYSDLEKEQIRLDTAVNRAQKELANLQDEIWEKYELTYNAAMKLAREDLGSKTAVQKHISELRGAMRRLGAVNLNAVEEFENLSEKYNMDKQQRDDIVKAQESLEQIIEQLTRKMEVQFREGFKQIAASFDQVFRKLFGGGKGILKLSEEAGVLECGIDIIAQPPGKKLQNMLLLSGGERALTAIALLFAIQQLNPAPFCVLDEIEAALDDANVNRFAAYLNELTEHTQFIVITHRKGTMMAANTMYGVTMEEKGISKCFSIHFRENDEMEWIKDGTV